MTEPTKKAKREVELNKLTDANRQAFTGPAGSDQKEWQAWLDLDAAEPMSIEESRRVTKSDPGSIVPCRWVRTNKAENPDTDPFIAKSRLVVQGFNCLLYTSPSPRDS